MNRVGPLLVAQWPADRTPEVRRGVGLTVINFNTAVQTLRCLESIQGSQEPPEWVLILDNASAAPDFNLLLRGCGALKSSELRVYRSETNLGFAGGSNFLIDLLMAEPACSFAGLINNDAVAKSTMVTRLVDAMAGAPRQVGLTGGRMHKLHAPDEVDTLGIAIYSSLMPADRKSTADPFFGPCGACCMLARELIAELKATSGYCFDERFFCYCEDTDLAMRAILLGYQPAYVDEVIALHEGQASSGSGYNRFIAYHGIRNTIWMHIKLMPTAILLRHSLSLVLLHAMIIGRTLAVGHVRLLFSIYRDALAQGASVLAERRRFQRYVKLTPQQLGGRFAPGFYRQGYLRLVLMQLWAQHRKKSA
jgi:GT2 family glycosyltransferase